jgi:hypothetical protein
MNLDFSATIPQIPFILEGLAITLKIVVYLLLSDLYSVLC